MSQLLNDDREFVWHPFTQHQTAGDPLPIVKANGTLLFDENGKSYIDANSSWWVNVHGHGNKYIGQALTEQFKAVDHIVFAGTTHPKAVELSKRICHSLPASFSKVFFSDNGSTAVEVALKMAVQYWFNKGEQRNRFVALEGSYHGDTYGAMSVAQRDHFNLPFEPMFFDTDYLPFPTKENIDDVLVKAEAFFKGGDIAGIILEPMVQGAAGMQMYSAEILDRIVALARENNVLVIFDEVMTGFGRTGRMFAMDHCDQKPDIVALSKGLTAGVMALGLTVTSNELFTTFLDQEMARGFLHGHSFTANPLACAVACASLDLFERNETTQSIDRIGSLHEKFAEQLKEINVVRNTRQCGTILAFEIESASGNSYFSDIRSKAYQHFLNDGVLIRPLGNTVFFNPPYCISDEEYAAVKNSIINFLETVIKG